MLLRICVLLSAQFAHSDLRSDPHASNFPLCQICAYQGCSGCESVPVCHIAQMWKIAAILVTYTAPRVPEKKKKNCSTKVSPSQPSPPLDRQIPPLQHSHHATLKTQNHQLPSSPSRLHQKEAQTRPQATLRQSHRHESPLTSTPRPRPSTPSPFPETRSPVTRASSPMRAPQRPDARSGVPGAVSRAHTRPHGGARGREAARDDGADACAGECGG